MKRTLERFFNKPRAMHRLILGSVCLLPSLQIQAQARADIALIQEKIVPIFDEKPVVKPVPNPAIESLRVFALADGDVNGFNALTMTRFGEEDQKRLSSEAQSVFNATIDRTEISANDNGRFPDVKAGDGIFTAFTNIDFDQLKEDEQAFLKRLQKSSTLEMRDFNGRSALALQKVETAALLREAKTLASQAGEVMTLPNKLRVIEVQSLAISLPLLPFTADENKVLAINSPAVVAHPFLTFDPCDTDGTGNDLNPNAAWSFKTLMSNMNQTGLSDQQFIHNWLASWMDDQTVNGFTLPEREGIKDYFGAWDGVNAGSLDINNLPFRTIAIINRVDLSKVSYLSATEGEIRFVFGLLNPVSCSPAAGVDQMTVIFEYGDTANSCSTIKSRAQEWLALDNEVLGSPAYMSALKTITDNVTEAPGAAAALNQVRTNDFAFDGLGLLASDWELREFVIDSGSGQLVPTTTKQTPDTAFRTGSGVMAQFMEQNANAILCENHVVPSNFLGAPFLGASLEYFNTSFWNAPTSQANLPASFPFCHNGSVSAVSPFLTLPTRIQSEVRHKFSINTCDDCHAQETDTFFTHVNPVTRSFSGFMTGITVPDPMLGPAVSGGIEREFDDLLRRGQILEDLAVKQCNGGIIFNSFFAEKSVPMSAVH